MNEQKRKPVGILLTVILIAALLTVCLELGLGYLRPDTPGSIPKHLIHFGIMFALLGGAVLLCLFCPPFKKLWAWIDEHILSQETRPIAIDIIYAVIAGLMLLHHFYVILYYPTLPTGATKFAPIWIFFAIITVLLGKAWKNQGFYLVAIFFVYTFERFYIKSPSVTGKVTVYFINSIYAFFICFGVLSALRSSIRRSFLQILCSLWAIATLVLSITGLYTAWTGIEVKNLVNSAILVDDGRLSIFSIATITASYLGCGAIMTLIGFSVSKSKIAKFLFLLVCLVTMTANSLTDTRASYLIIALMIASTLCIGLFTIYQSKKTTFSWKKATCLIVTLILCFGICLYGAIEGQRYLGTRFIMIRNNGSTLISNAKAEDILIDDQELTDTPTLPIFEQRDIGFSENTDINETFSNRLIIWNRIYNYLREHPKTLAFGLSVDGSIGTANWRNDHSHNLILQLILEGGIPALSLFIVLICYGLFHSLRIWKHANTLFWQRVLPIPVFSILLWEMVECLTHFSFDHPPMTLFWFFLGATITVSKSLGKASKTAEHPAIPAESAVTETGE